MAVAIIGAGVAGLACARALSAKGKRVVVFEKEAIVGGRVASRLVDLPFTSTNLFRNQSPPILSKSNNSTPTSFWVDEGAPYFTARDPRFIQVVDEMKQKGAAAEWTAMVGVLQNGSFSEPKEHVERFCAVPSQLALPQFLAAPFRKDIVRTSTPIVSLSANNAGWWDLMDEKGNLQGTFAAVVFALPPELTLGLLPSSSSIRGPIEKIHMRPCWTVIALTSQTPLSTSIGAAFVNDADIGFVVRNNSKPSRSDTDGIVLGLIQMLDVWTLYSTWTWSEANKTATEAEAASHLIKELELALGTRLEVKQSSARLWPNAIPESVHPEKYLWDSNLKIGACGDWCGGPRVEGAFISGLEMAAKVEEALKRMMPPSSHNL